MKINELKINSYGKLKNKDIKLDNGINIIYGENEKGKSTLLNFIVNSFYGTSRNKKGRDISDYDRYKPWDVEEFSGKLTYTLDNNKKYEIFREFSKKNPKLYDENMEEVSKKYSVDKSLGNQFFFEQTNVDEQTFVSSFASFQNEVELNGSMQNILLQKIANSSTSGDDSISYKKAMEKLNKKQLDEIGTSRSQGKPINIVINEIENISSRNEHLKKYENYKYEIEDKYNILHEEIENLNVKYEFLKKCNKIVQEEKIEKEKIKYNEKKIDELESKIQKLIKQKESLIDDKDEIKESKSEVVKIFPYAIVALILCVVAVIIFIFSKSALITLIPIILTVITISIYFYKNKKIKDKNMRKEQSNIKIVNKNKEIELKVYEIDAQLELLEKSRNEQIEDVEKIKNEVITNINNNKEKLKVEYYNKIEIYDINKYFSLSNLPSEIEKFQNLINEKNLELHRLKLDKENIMPKLEELAENEEKLAASQELYEELKEKNSAINLAKEILESSYQKMKSNVTPKFTQNLSKNVSKITNEKYNKIIINEEDGILVELPNGEYKDAGRLSLGTIQQIYLSFRLSIAQNLTDESMPIILDETFAFYDDNRLKETLKNLKEHYADEHQIILLTCTNREEKILDELGFIYNKVCL